MDVHWNALTTHYCSAFGVSHVVVKRFVSRTYMCGLCFSLFFIIVGNDCTCRRIVCHTTVFSLGWTFPAVGATTRSDTRAGYSNFGECTDIWAPGDKIVSISHRDDIGYRDMPESHSSGCH